MTQLLYRWLPGIPPALQAAIAAAHLDVELMLAPWAGLERPCRGTIMPPDAQHPAPWPWPEDSELEWARTTLLSWAAASGPPAQVSMDEMIYDAQGCRRRLSLLWLERELFPGVPRAALGVPSDPGSRPLAGSVEYAGSLCYLWQGQPETVAMLWSGKLAGIGRGRDLPLCIYVNPLRHPIGSGVPQPLPAATMRRVWTAIRDNLAPERVSLWMGDILPEWVPVHVLGVQIMREIFG